MRLVLVVVLAVGTGGTARASQLPSCGTQASKLRLIVPVSHHGAVPLPPSPAAPIRAATRGSLLLLGLGLTAGGLVLGGAGFAVLYLCREGTSCHSQSNTTVGWVLAAPGILPLVVGLAILYFGSGGGRRVELSPTDNAPQWAFGAMPLSGGGMISGGLRF